MTLELPITVSVLPVNGASTNDDCSRDGVVQRRLQSELGHDEARQLNTQRRQISARSGITSRKGLCVMWLFFDSYSVG